MTSPVATPTPLDLLLDALAERAKSPRVKAWAQALLAEGEAPPQQPPQGEEQPD
jgi:hypothetical protein